MAPAEDALALRELYEVFRRERPTIVHTHNPKPGLYGRLAARAARVPVVVNTIHGLYALPDDPLAKRAIVYGLERIASTCSDAELLQNPEDLPVLRRLGVPARKLHVLGNGIDLTRFDVAALDEVAVKAVRAEMGVEPDAVVIGAVGRLVREKGYLELFEAVRLARVACPQLRLVVVGPSEPDKADAISEAEIARAADAGVVFLGHRDDVDTLYGAMDAYVLASHREGFPRSAMEAAAMGLPIVATDIRGCRQVVDHGTTGLLVPLGDVDLLADALALDRERSRSAARHERRGEGEGSPRVRPAARDRSDVGGLSRALGSGRQVDLLQAARRGRDVEVDAASGGGLAHRRSLGVVRGQLDVGVGEGAGIVDRTSGLRHRR